MNPIFFSPHRVNYISRKKRWIIRLRSIADMTSARNGIRLFLRENTGYLAGIHTDCK